MKYFPGLIWKWLSTFRRDVLGGDLSALEPVDNDVCVLYISTGIVDGNGGGRNMEGLQ